MKGRANFGRKSAFPICSCKRKEDIPLLVHYFIDRYAKQAGKRITPCQQEESGFAAAVSLAWQRSGLHPSPEHGIKTITGGEDIAPESNPSKGH
jgi:hypothetical protein